LRGRLRELAAEQRRFGYRRLHILLRAEGQVLTRKKTQRLYREEGLTVRKHKGRKRAMGKRATILVEPRPNARWSVDFVHDQLSNRRRFRILNVIDDVTKECLAASVDTSISGRRVARELDAIIARRGKPDLVISDQWNRVHLQRYARLGSKQSNRLAFHCARKTDAEWDLRRSTAHCSMRRSSTILITLDRRWRFGPQHTIRSALTRRSAISPPAEFAVALSATGDRLRNLDQLRRSAVAPPALLRQSQPATLVDEI
jgi:putative transposase